MNNPKQQGCAEVGNTFCGSLLLLSQPAREQTKQLLRVFTLICSSFSNLVCISISIAIAACRQQKFFFYQPRCSFLMVTVVKSVLAEVKCSIYSDMEKLLPFTAKAPPVTQPATAVLVVSCFARACQNMRIQSLNRKRTC